MIWIRLLNCTFSNSCIHRLDYYTHSIVSIMCGIICEIYRLRRCITIDQQVMDRICKRGPDCTATTEVIVSDEMKIYFGASVLWMQGEKPVPQPIENEYGVLLYNGDLYDENLLCNAINDTELIMDTLSNPLHISGQYVIQKLKTLKGPFSLIYYNKQTQELYFARDRIGRNSLLIHKNEDSICISSVLGRKYECVEVPATHICIWNLKTHEINLHPWENDVLSIQNYDLDYWLTLIEVQQNLPDDKHNIHFEEILDFTGQDEIVEHITACALKSTCKKSLFRSIIEHPIIKETVLNLSELLEKSTELRLRAQPNRCKVCVLNHVADCRHSPVGVLFSGGLDCSILAYLANKYLPKEQSIELINIAFNKDSNGTYDVPDRLTGRQSCEELQRICPSRKWIFKAINIGKDMLEHYQKTVIGDLVYPRQTILDESLGSALWFAAQAKDRDEESQCRVLLLGSGADELFGGYVRHRNAFKRNGWSGLSRELALDWNRISFRNLARDNRVICDHGRQPRMPYLDEDFVKYVLQLKPWLKCFPTDILGAGIGDKLMLRLIANNYGLTETATLPKRALQFGSRIANKKDKGSDISTRFLKNK